LEELEQRLGIRSKESTPSKEAISRLEKSQARLSSVALEEFEQRLNLHSRQSTPAKEVASPQPTRFPGVTPKLAGSPEPQAESYGRSYSTAFDVSARQKSFVGDEVESSVTFPIVRASESGSPVRRSRTPRTSLISVSTPSPKPTQDAIEEMKRRFLRQDSPSPTSSSPSQIYNQRLPHTPRLSHNLGDEYAFRRLTPDRSTLDLSNSSHRSPHASLPKPSRDSLRGQPEVISLVLPSVSSTPPIPTTPDLISDASDNALSSAPSSPPLDSLPRRVGLASMPSSCYGDGDEDDMFDTEIPSVQLVSAHKKSEPRPSPTPSTDAMCAKCTLPLFNLNSLGRYVTVPEPSASGNSPRMYHSECFRCRICDGVFEEKERGQAVFVRGVKGACHLEVCTTCLWSSWELLSLLLSVRQRRR
jgi:hypothetical protein